MIKVAIIGVGTVGSSVANILKKNAKIIEARSGKKIVPVIGVVKNLNKKRDVDIELTDDINEVLDRDDIDIYIELMGGVENAYNVVKKILKKGKTVITANKALLAYHRYELQQEARVLDTSIGIEASVAGGIPVVKALREGLSANQILAIKGIINGTCNFILSKMMNEKANFKHTLEEAQKLGYAEADPTFDVGGFDTAHKLLILASIAYGVDAKPEDILIEGIENISPEDIYFANDFEYNIKLLGIAKKIGKKVELRVHPALVPKDKMLAKVDGVMNGVSIVGDSVGETMYYGAGAGGDATASAVIADIIDIVREDKSSPMLGYIYSPDKEKLTLMPQKDIETKYYVRVKVKDEIGVLAKISKLLQEHKISVDSFLQKPEIKENDYTTLFFSTHTCKESDIQKALEKIANLEFMLEKPMIIRIED
ncbi:MAG: homoserine dehydrogenase [Campylobacteraceae bacterium]|jgi:homoserine dehydrogenase|nr:homoserine dehydrogenase [Campylobacteraceae bacterium]